MNLRSTLIALLLLLATSSAQASRCSVTGTATAFGVYTSSNPSPIDTTGTITVSCQGTGNVSYVITLSTGQSGTYAARKMRNTAPAYQLNYNLFVNSARTIPWGNGTSGTATISDAYRLPGSGQEVRTYTVYGRLAAGQSPLASGNYLDSITVTVDY
ncbi:MAG: spore coat protein U domain-containing protein [Bdellovibrionales bacterium]|nr:spore coat protein U domain-containing protein [Bdellovibrionales bacterium]